MIKAYYQLAKPGIIYGNALTAAAGFFLAVGGLLKESSRPLSDIGGVHGNANISWPHLIFLLIAMLIGLALIIGGSCVFNNYYDRIMDGKMERTKNRALVTGAISPTAALIYGSCLLVLGAVVLYFGANVLTMLVALIGSLFYVLLYTPLKHRTDFSALVGAVAGATPPVVGFCAVTGSLSFSASFAGNASGLGSLAGLFGFSFGSFGIEALILFLILMFWQMPHFYAIAMYRGSDYAAAGMPTLPHMRGAHVAKINMLFYVLAFMIAAASLTLLGFTGYVYLAVVLVLGIAWLWICVQGFRRGMNDAGAEAQAKNLAWSRRMFLFSLVVVTVLSLVLAVAAVVR